MSCDVEINKRNDFINLLVEVYYTISNNTKSTAENLCKSGEILIDLESKF